MNFDFNLTGAFMVNRKEQKWKALGASIKLNIKSRSWRSLFWKTKKNTWKMETETETGHQLGQKDENWTENTVGHKSINLMQWKRRKYPSEVGISPFSPVWNVEAWMKNFTNPTKSNIFFCSVDVSTKSTKVHILTNIYIKILIFT